MRRPAKPGMHNICERPDAYEVTAKRAGVIHRTYIPKRKPGALAEAKRARDRMVGTPTLPTRQKTVRSNTGVMGISETTFWDRSHARPCYAVNWRENGRRKTKRFFFHNTPTKTAAFEAAKRLRAAKVKGGGK